MPPASRRIGTPGFWLACAIIIAAVVAVTWPQAISITNKIGGHTDALFSVWRLSWFADSGLSNDHHVFDAPIFYPYRDTLAYSDAILLSAVLTAPFRWLGCDPFVVYNSYLLISFIATGLMAALLCQAITGSWVAAAIGGIVFTVNPHRMEHFERLELITSFGIPLAFYCWHIAVQRRSTSRFVWVVLAVAVQWYLGMYHAVFLATVLPLLFLHWLTLDSATKLIAIKGTALGTLLTMAVVTPSIGPYMRARHDVGERDLSEVAVYSAEWSDFVAVHPRNVLYGDTLGRFGFNERHFFPGVLVTLLAVIGLILAPPVEAALYSHRGRGSLHCVWCQRPFVFDASRAPFAISWSSRTWESCGRGVSSDRRIHQYRCGMAPVPRAPQRFDIRRPLDRLHDHRRVSHQCGALGCATATPLSAVVRTIISRSLGVPGCRPRPPGLERRCQLHG